MNSATDAPTVARLQNDPALLDALTALENECFSVPWSRASFASALTNELYGVFGAFDGERLIGYAVISVFDGDGDLQNLAADPRMRRRGIGRALLDTCLAFAAQRDAARVFLEVREGNAAARALYEGAGFVLFGRRKNYYRAPTEDALLMVKLL